MTVVPSSYHTGMLLSKDCNLAHGVFKSDIPSAVKVEWYEQQTINGIERFVFQCVWYASKPRTEAIVAKYGRGTVYE